MKAQIRRYHSPDVGDLHTYVPEDSECFSILLQVMAGPENSDGEESFDIVVCTPRYLEGRLEKEQLVFGRHLLLVKRFDFRAIRNTIEDYCSSLEEADWPALAAKLDRIGRWEFADYHAS
jgi:hypothetical protein